MSTETDNLAEAEMLMRNVAAESARGAASPTGLVMAEYDRRGVEIKRLRAQLQLATAEGSFANYGRQGPRGETYGADRDPVDLFRHPGLITPAEAMPWQRLWRRLRGGNDD